MVCSFFKKAVVGAALGVGTLWLISGTPAYNYVKTAWNYKWDCVQKTIPVEFQIKDLQRQVADLEHAMKGQIQNVAREERQIDELKKNLATNQVTLRDSGKKILALRETVPAENVQLTSDGANRAAVVRDLKSRVDRYNIVEQTVATQTSTLAKREEALGRAKEQLEGLKGKKAELISRLELIATQNRANQAAAQGTQPGIDTSALTQIEKQVKELEQQVSLQARENELTQQYLGEPEAAPAADDTGDVLNAIDAKFGKGAKSDDKSL